MREVQSYARDWGLESVPPTLSAEYVVADASRNALLQPWFVAINSESDAWIHGVHVTEIPGTAWRDASSPYGYGGPIATSTDDEFLRLCWSSYVQFMNEQRIVAEYVRFHPALGNERFYGGNIADNREVVTVDLDGVDVAAGYAPRLRTTLRKADKKAIVYLETDLGASAERFYEFHWSALREMGADSFYLFPLEYFRALAASGVARLAVCVHDDGAMEQGHWLAAAIFLEANVASEYHLAASSREGRALGASSFLLDQAAMSAQRRGRKYLYLGGGTDRNPTNPLLFFKAGFSPKRLMYLTGSTIFNSRGREEVKQAYPDEWRAHSDRPIFHRKV